MHQLIRVENFFITQLRDSFINAVSNIDYQRETINVSKSELEEIILKFNENLVYFYADPLTEPLKNNFIDINKYSYILLDDYQKIQESCIALIDLSNSTSFYKKISILNEVVEILKDYYSFAIETGYLDDNPHFKDAEIKVFKDIENIKKFNSTLNV